LLRQIELVDDELSARDLPSEGVRRSATRRQRECRLQAASTNPMPKAAPSARMSIRAGVDRRPGEGQALSLMADDVVCLNPVRKTFGRMDFPPASRPPIRKLGFVASASWKRLSSSAKSPTYEVAYTLCRDSLSVTPRAGGAATELAGHRITVYRKQADGCWLLARDAHTLPPGGELT
jgi:hypothetical protein